jgi:hypothetical protein
LYVVGQYSGSGDLSRFGLASRAPQWVVNLNVGVTKLEEKCTFFAGFP